MPKSDIEIKIDKATNENNVVEDWGLFLDIVDQINHSNSQKEIIKIFIKKLNDKDPHVVEHTISLLNACVSNCNRTFKLEVCSRIFVEELKNFVLRKRFEKLSRAMALNIEKWTKENDFKNDPALNLIPSLYMDLKRQGVDFNVDVTQASASKAMKQEILDRKEEEELERAIQLSLKESQAKSSGIGKSSVSSSTSTASPFGQLMQTTQNITESYATNSSTTPKTSAQQKRRVKALYDFEAAEDNEITFKAGDLLFLSDDSDPNWWKGFDMNGVEGLFPSNFVTFDLNEKVEVFDPKTNMTKKVSFSENVDVNLIQDVQPGPKKIVIDEKKIDECIEMLQNADPTGEIQPDSQEMLELEEECYMMGPLIDKKLQDIDEQHAELEDLNLKILEAFQFYNNLMKESISKQTALISNSQLPPPTASAGAAMNMPGLGLPPQSVQTNGSINYAAAPPSLEANSLNFANKLNSMAYAQMTPPSNGYPNVSSAGQIPNSSSLGLNPSGSYSHNVAMNMAPTGLSQMYPGQYMGSMNGSGASGAGLMHNPSQSSMNGTQSMMGPSMSDIGLPNSQPQMTSSNFN